MLKEVNNKYKIETDMRTVLFLQIITLSGG